MSRKFLVLIIAIAVILTGCTSTAHAPGNGDSAAPAVYPGEDWVWAKSPESLGWSPAKLAVAQAYAKRIGSAAVMIVDDGVVVAGWGDISRKYLCHSMRKSLISALYGIYTAEGKINLEATLKELGVDDLTPLGEVEKTATVRNLLSARSGVYIEAAGESAGMKALRPPRGSHAPDTFWYYNNWDFNALGTIFDQLSGEKNIYAAFDKRIADPIGMQDYDPEELHYSYEPYSKHPYYGFRLSTRDAARFGLLFLRNGRWDNKQIVPADWVRESTTAKSVYGPGSGYAYLWWTGEGEGGFPNVDEGPGSYYASGFGGHNIIVMPARNLVVVHRVNTEVGDSVDDMSIGTLLWLILDAAGQPDIGDPPLLERAVGTRLTADTMAQALDGCTLSVSEVGAQITVTFAPGRMMTALLNGSPLGEIGTWRTEGDHFCQELGPGFGTSGCYDLVLNGDRITAFDLDGYALTTYEYRR